MGNRVCPDCGEEYSTTYRKCPFCEEDAALKQGTPIHRRGGRRLEKGRDGGVGGILLVVLGVVVLHNLIGTVMGLGLAKVLSIEYSRATAIAIEVGMQNSGLAVSLAAANFSANPMATLPGAVFSVWHNIAGSLFAGMRRRKHRELPVL